VLKRSAVLKGVKEQRLIVWRVVIFGRQALKSCVRKLCFSKELFSSLFFLLLIIFTALIAIYETLFAFIIHYLGLPW
jgi:hypothetical protein